MRIEEVILTSLLNDDEYGRRVLPFIKSEYFEDATESQLFDKINNFIQKYNNLPTKQTLLLDIEQDDSLTSEQYESLCNAVKNHRYEENDDQWLIDQTEKFCQERAVYNGIMKSISILNGNENKLDKGSIPSLLQDALGVSFDTNVGHDLLEDAEDRFNFYHMEEERVEFDLEYFNEATRGGFPKKTLNVFIAGTGVGKTFAMCHMAAANLIKGYNVLYITMEMAEERIAERIDANLLGIPVSDLETVDWSFYEQKINKLKLKTTGKLIVKEFPTASAGSNHFRHLINELRLKKKFKPDIIYIDYLNICASSRIRPGAGVNSYSYIKAISEEIRGLAVEMEVPIISATQLNREGFVNSDPGMENTSESFGLPQTVDFMCALIIDEQMEELGQMYVKVLKNRYCDPTRYARRFIVGVDRSRMKLHDVEQGDQDIMQDVPVMDNSAFGSGMKAERKSKLETLFDN